MRIPQKSREKNYFKISNPLENKPRRKILPTNFGGGFNSSLTAFFPVIHWVSDVSFGKKRPFSRGVISLISIEILPLSPSFLSVENSHYCTHCSNLADRLQNENQRGPGWVPARNDIASKESSAGYRALRTWVLGIGSPMDGRKRLAINQFSPQPFASQGGMDAA
jgi:hypothetical protein